MIVTTGYDDAIGGGPNGVPSKFSQRVADITDQDAAGAWKALLAGVAFPIVEHPDVEIRFRRETRDRLADVAAADNQQRDARQHREVTDTVLCSGSRPLLERGKILDYRIGKHLRGRLCRQTAMLVKEIAAARGRA